MLNLMSMSRLVLCSTTSRSLLCHNRFFAYRSSLQYFPTTGFSTTRRVIFNNASSYFRKNGLMRQLTRRRCTGPPSSEEPHLSLFQRFKKMWKDYWYVMIPVHVVTSVGWFGAFYRVAVSGVDIGYYLRKLGVSENIVKHITDSGMGNIAIAWALYKVATPARYAVTLGGTTLSINVLRNMGYIKPAKVLMAKGRDKMKSLKDKQFPNKE